MTMSLPQWIADRLDEGQELETRLSQRHVVETMFEGDRPFFSIQEIHDAVKPDVSKSTVRNRLEELEASGIVATETYPDSLSLYYLNYPESDWPITADTDEHFVAKHSTKMMWFRYS